MYIYITFIDYIKEFDIINHETLWIILMKMVYVSKIIPIMMAVYTDIKVRVSGNGKLTTPNT